MNVNEVANLYAYNRWANRRCLDAVRGLQSGEFTRDLGASYGSLRGTLVHILWAEWLWLQRWRGESPKRLFDAEEFPSVESIESYWAEVERGQAAFIAGLTDQRLEGRISYENLQGQRWEYSLCHMMQHLANHSSYHRGQVITLLRQLRHSAPATDFLVYLDEVAAGAV